MVLPAYYLNEINVDKTRFIGTNLNEKGEF